jgi:hypothetical protein
MVQPIVEQLRFARSEFARSLDGVTADEGLRRFGSINCLGWIVGHLANHEQRFWLERRGESLLVPGLNELVGWGRPASTPPIEEMWTAWRAITAAVDPYLDSLTAADLETSMVGNGKTSAESIGTMLHRTIYHYWFHNGEAQAIRQLLGHTNLPQFVGKIGEEAPYRPE